MGLANNDGINIDSSEKLRIKNCDVYEMFGKTMPASGMYLRHVRGITFENVRTSVLKPDARPEIVMIDVEGVAPAGFGGEGPAATSPAAR